MAFTYDWQKFYKAALSKLNRQKMQQEDITKAEQAIQQRLTDCPPSIMDGVEKRAIGDTLAALAVLKTEIA